jgi:WD40 repeat protein
MWSIYRQISKSIFAISILIFCFLTTQAQLMPADALIARLKTPDHRIETVAYSHDGKLIAAGYGFYSEGGITIWNVRSRSVVTTINKGAPAKAGIKRIAFDRAGKIFAAASDKGDLFVWNVGNWYSYATALTTAGKTTDMDISPDGSLIALAFEESAVVYDVRSKQTSVILSGMKFGTSPYGISFDPDGKSVVVTASNAITIWSIATKSIVKEWNPKAFGFFGRLSDDGKLLIAGGGAIYGKKSVVLWRIPDGNKVNEISGFRSGLFSLAISHNAKYFAVGGGTYGPDGAALSLWSLDGPRELGFVSFGDTPIQGLAFSPDDKTLAVGSSEGYVRLYDIAKFGGPKIVHQTESLCGEVVRDKGELYFVPLSKVPYPMSEDFDYNWKLKIANPESLTREEGLPVSLDDWSIESFAANDQIRIQKSTKLGVASTEQGYIIFGDIQNPGWNTGSILKIYADSTYVTSDNPGKCVSHGSLKQFDTDFETVKKRLLQEGLLTISKDPLTLGTDHYRTRFVILSTDGREEPRSDADDIQVLLNSGPAKKREAFITLYLKEESFINMLLKRRLPIQKLNRFLTSPDKCYEQNWQQ